MDEFLSIFNNAFLTLIMICCMSMAYNVYDIKVELKKQNCSETCFNKYQ
jgi:hypothetical protein